jgi:hypothetical protein
VTPKTQSDFQHQIDREFVYRRLQFQKRSQDFVSALSALQGLTLWIARLLGRDREFAANIYCVTLYSVLIFGMMACVGWVIFRLLQ